MTKFKIYFLLFVISTFVIAYFILNMEFVQKKIFDIKADISGSERTIAFYTTVSNEKVTQFSDKDMRFEYTNGVVSVWLGSKNKKVHSNMNYIIEDK